LFPTSSPLQPANHLLLHAASRKSCCAKARKLCRGYGPSEERIERSAEESERVATWLKSEQAKEFLRRSPELKEVFSSAAVAAKAAPKEQAPQLLRK